jgi:hypothetical protein
MNPVKKLALAVATLAAICTLHAQQTYQPPVPASTSIADRPGVLGQSYTELSFGAEDFPHNSDHAYDATLRGNIPLTPNIDAGLGYGYSWLNGDTGVHTHLLATDAKFYGRMDNRMKPFIGGLVGYQWARTDFDNQFPVITTHDDRWVWGASAGIELSAGSLAVTPRVAYLDTMVNNSIGHYAYGVEVNHWFSPSFAGYADVSYNDHRRRENTWSYLAGVRLKF